MKKFLIKMVIELFKALVVAALTCLVLWLCKPWLFQWWFEFWLSPKKLFLLLFVGLFVAVMFGMSIIVDMGTDLVKWRMKKWSEKEAVKKSEEKKTEIYDWLFENDQWQERQKPTPFQRVKKQIRDHIQKRGVM